MTKNKGFTHQDLEIVEKTRVFNGFLKLDKWVFKHALFEGGESGLVEREIIERGHAVAVLPYDPKTDQVLLIEQLRIGALSNRHSPWLFECIAGMVEESENHEQVAIRESYEEAGLQLSELTYMLSYLSSPGGTTERLYLYLALTDLSVAGGVYGLAEEDEDIKVHVLSRDKALAMLESEQIDNAATVIALQWLALNWQNYIVK